MNANPTPDQTFLSQDGAHVITTWRSDLAAVMPHARTLDWQGARMLVIPNQPDEAKVARNLGVAVPSPILTRYDWCNSKPWDIQRITAALLAESPRCYVLNSMGTGKTRSVLFAADYLMNLGLAHKMLVVAPLSTLTPVWEREIFNLMMRRRPTEVLHGSRDKRLKLLEAGAQIYIINPDGLKIIQDDLIAAGFDILVLDELAIYRNKRTELWSAAHSILIGRGKKDGAIKYAWGLTGSPTPNAPTDAWGQAKLLTPERVTRTFSAFQERTMFRVTTFRWVPKPEANATVQDAMQPSVRFSREDVMELPPCSVVDRRVELDQETERAYELLAQKSRMLIRDGDAITAVNEGVLQSKLLQVSCGFIYTDSRGVYALPTSKRFKALDEILLEVDPDRKIIILVPFIHALEGVLAHLHNKRHAVASVSGDTPLAARNRIFGSFQDKDNPRIIVAHPECLAHGLTLTRANTIIWWSPTNSLEIYEQANARIVRPGQTSKTLVVHMVATAVEQATYARLKSKQKMQGLLLELFKQQEVSM